MSEVIVTGLGAISPAGWGLPGLRAALRAGEPLATTTLTRPGWSRPLRVRTVPAPEPRPPCLSHPRLRRASAISHYAVAAALEALGEDRAEVAAGRIRLGIVFCVATGGVAYSRRFLEETLRDPATASPMLFPETVLNAPASHVAAVLESRGINYALVADAGGVLQGLAVAAGWLMDGHADIGLVIGADELDWPVVDAVHNFHRNHICAAGAGALRLQRAGTGKGLAQLDSVTEPRTLSLGGSRTRLQLETRAQLPPPRPGEILLESRHGHAGVDAPELNAWHDWPGRRLAVKPILGEGLAAGAAWQCVAACDWLARREAPAAVVNVAGLSQQSVAARFLACAGSD